jgi:hypothetical protein
MAALQRRMSLSTNAIDTLRDGVSFPGTVAMGAI